MSGETDLLTLDRETFITKNLGLVGEVAKRYIRTINNHSVVDFEDLKQIGTVGLIKAYDRFDISYGVKFSTYAVPMIEGEILRFIRDNLDLIRYSRQIKMDFNEIYKADLVDEEPEKIANELNIPIDRVKNALAYYRSHCPGSLQLVVHDEDSVPLTLEDRLGHEVDFDTNLEIQLLLQKLDKRTRKIVELRLRGLTQTQIAKRLGLSQMTISRILSSLRKRIKEELN